VTFWQRARQELGRETQPVGTVVRLIIIERAVRGTLVLILGIALLTDSRQIGRLVRRWVAELDLNPERRLIPRATVAVLRPFGLLSTRTVIVLGLGAVLFAALRADRSGRPGPPAPVGRIPDGDRGLHRHSV